MYSVQWILAAKCRSPQDHPCSWHTLLAQGPPGHRQAQEFTRVASRTQRSRQPPSCSLLQQGSADERWPREEAHGAGSGSHQARASSCPLPVELRRQHGACFSQQGLVTCAESYHPGKLSRGLTSRVFTGHWPCRRSWPLASLALVSSSLELCWCCVGSGLEGMCACGFSLLLKSWSGFGIRLLPASGRVGKCFLISCFFGRVCEGLLLILWIIGHSEAIYIWAFLCWKPSHYEESLCPCSRSYCQFLL